jgi:two-component system CheB/CheR fusion protein
MSDGDTLEGPVEDIATDPDFAHLLDTLSLQYRFDVREYKHPSLARRIKSRMQQVRVDTVDKYLDYLARHPDEHVALFNTILINITGFFRDPGAWKVLESEVVPRLVEQATGSRSLRVWSVGCSSGEEAYSAAILLAEQLGPRIHDVNVRIYATDVDDDALGAARPGLYRAEDIKDVPSSLLERYFAREGQAYRFRRDLRRWVIFGRHNVVQDPPLSHIDLLICRNVLIYFTSELQEKILPSFRYAIREGGYLFLGRAESVLARSHWFSPVNLTWRIFERTTTPAPTTISARRQGSQDEALPETSRLIT